MSVGLFVSPPLQHSYSPKAREWVLASFTVKTVHPMQQEEERKQGTGHDVCWSGRKGAGTLKEANIITGAR